MNVVKEVFGIKVTYLEDNPFHLLPNYMRSRYEIKSARFYRQKVFLLYPKGELDSFSSIKKHIEKMQQIDNIPVVIVLQRITATIRKGFITNDIPFIVSNKQCYLPFLGMLLTERCDAEIHKKNTLIPSAQMLLFYYIYSNKKELFTSPVAQILNISAMTMTRAIRNLEQAGLIHAYKSGVHNVISSDLSKKELYIKAKPFLVNPVRRVIYIPANMVSKDFLYSGESALSSLSMLNAPRIVSYATNTDNQLKDVSTDILTNDREQVRLEVWKYNPRSLSNQNCVDILSLATCYKDCMDERIEACIDDILDKYLEDIHD